MSYTHVKYHFMEDRRLDDGVDSQQHCRPKALKHADIGASLVSQALILLHKSALPTSYHVETCMYCTP